MKYDQYISGCRQGDRRAQNQLFEAFAPVALAICYRYIPDYDSAQDILIQSFVRIFRHLDDYSGNGSFEGWMKRIVINECLMELRRKKNLHLTLSIDEIKEELVYSEVDHLAFQEVLDLLNELPIGYRTVFNMYVMEGFKHREIAELLDISINTSKSQLILARRKLQELFKKKFESRIA